MKKKCAKIISENGKPGSISSMQLSACTPITCKEYRVDTKYDKNGREIKTAVVCGSVVDMVGAHVSLTIDGSDGEKEKATHILPTCHKCNMRGKTLKRAAHCYMTDLVQLKCACHFFLENEDDFDSASCSQYD
jgi:hypothetical protein